MRHGRKKTGARGSVKMTDGSACIRHYLGQVRQEAAGRADHECERGGQVVVLHRRGVVVPQRERVAVVDEEFVGAAAVLKVVDYLDNRKK